MISQINQYSSRLQEYLTNTILPQMQFMMKNISASFLDLLVFLKNFLIGAIVSLYILADKEGFVAKAKMAVLRIKPLVDLSAERSWIPQLSVYCVMLEHRSSEPHMRFWSV